MFLLAEAVAVSRHFCLRCLPPRHTRAPATCQLLRNQSEGAVGFSVKRNAQKGRWEVDVVYPDTPASREPRLQEKTAIYKVNGESTVHLEYDQLRELLQGPAGSNVEISVKKGFSVFGSKTVVLKRAAPSPFDAPLCFALQCVRRRVGCCALAATLTAKLASGVKLTRRIVRRLDEAILRRVFGLQFIDAAARRANDELAHMLRQPTCPFMVCMQVICSHICNYAPVSHLFTDHLHCLCCNCLTVPWCRMMRGKESTIGDYFMMLLLMSNTVVHQTLYSLNSSYLPIQPLSMPKNGNRTFSAHSCTVVAVAR
jgi:hypothetical protein